MILYKYFNPAKGNQFIKDCLINFTPPKFFNDPFEVTATYPVPTDAELVLERKNYTDEIYRSNYYILSLTRSPLNKLMWAHYTQDHKGFVVGIDVDQSVFTNLNTCTIPVQFGNVIYTQTKPKSLLLNSPKNSACTYAFPKYTFKGAEMLQRLFLYKSVDWAYEEEVRIVKLFGDIGLHPGEDDEFSIEKSKQFYVSEENGLTYFKLKLSADLIREIYFGVNNELYH